MDLREKREKYLEGAVLRVETEAQLHFAALVRHCKPILSILQIRI